MRNAFSQETLNTIDFTELFFNLVPAQVHAAMPELDCNFKEVLTEFCKDVGIKTVFTEKADFSPMITTSVHVKSFYQQARITLNHRAKYINPLTGQELITKDSEKR